MIEQWRFAAPHATVRVPHANEDVDQDRCDNGNDDGVSDDIARLFHRMLDAQSQQLALRRAYRIAHAVGVVGVVAVQSFRQRGESHLGKRVTRGRGQDSGKNEGRISKQSD